jgi:2-polyprenyl-3-methyl-5-hydroxy-6-metoxy-1,4-benzoquinol methylase
MRPIDDAVLRHYETVREEDRIARGFAQLELRRVQEVLRRHLPRPPASVLDVGGATGIHSRWLAEDGYRVRIIDITPRHVAKANADLGHLGITAEIGDARYLQEADDSFDVVLMFGPLYHLTEYEDRIRALREAARVVRPGGLIAVAAINRFASLLDGLARGFLFDHEFAEMVTLDLATGQHRNPEERPHWWTTAFFHHPHQLRDEATAADLEVIELVGTEGLAVFLPQLVEHWDRADDREVIMWSARAIESEPTLLGLSPHLLLVATPQPSIQAAGR